MRILLVAGMLLALGAPASAQQVDQRLQTCIAHVVYGEARGEQLEGQFAVAWSLIFRAAVNQSDFGGSDICSVAYKTTVLKSGAVRYQYDGVKTPPRVSPEWDTAAYVAYMTLLGEGQPNLPIMYFCDIKTPGACSWHNRDTQDVGTIGTHRFYLDPRFPAFMTASMQ